MASSGGREGAARLWGPLVAFATALALTACVPPTAPGPTVRDRPEGRGIVEGTDVAPSAGCESPTATMPGRSTVTIPWQGATRTALLTVPAHEASAHETPRPRSLVVSLHPFTLAPGGWEAYSGLAEAAAARGHVAVSPLGSTPGPRWAVPGGLAGPADDIGFVDALVSHLEDTLCIDRNREFAAGFSAGAAMAQALSCTLPWRFAAVAGSGGANLTDPCPDSAPTDVFILHGTADPIAPAGGSYVPFAPPLGLSIDRVAATDAARAGCGPRPEVSRPADGVEALTWPLCEDGHRVQHWRMLGAGHTWAGAAGPPLDLFVGPTLQSFSATDAVLDFFDATWSEAT